MSKEGLPLRILARKCDECESMEAEYPGSCPVQEFTTYIKEKVGHRDITIRQAYAEARKRGLHGTGVFVNGPADQANLWCPHRIEQPIKEDVFLFKLRAPQHINVIKTDEQ